MRQDAPYFSEIRLADLPDDATAQLAEGPYAAAAAFARFRMVELDDCPAAFCAAFARPDAATEAWHSGWRLVGGRGLDPVAAVIGCAGELTERMSLVTRGESDPLVGRGAQDGAEVAAAAILKLSDRQQAALVGRHPAVKARTGDRIDWARLSNRTVRARDATSGRSVAVPSICILLGEEPYFGIAEEAVASSAGAAAHPDPETAELNALLELAEHDAVGIWWFNRLQGRNVPIEAIEGRSARADALVAWLAERARQTWLVELPGDLSAHVVAAFSAQADGSRIAYGFCARLEREAAAVGALLEMLQCELSLTAMEQRASAGGLEGSAVPELLRWSRKARTDAMPHLRGTAGGIPPGTKGGDAARFRKEIGLRGTYVADVTRPDLGGTVLKAVSTELRDRLPRLAPGRLYNLPVSLGLRAHALSEETLNVDRLLI